MNTNTDATTHPDISIQDLRISTDLTLHPDFTKNPDKFAFTHDVELVERLLPEVSFKNDYDTGDKVESAKAHISLVHRDAIRLFVKNTGRGYRLISIIVNPAVLMRHSNRSITAHSIYSGLELLKSNIAPLLDNPDDVRYIIPGLAGDDGEHRSYWSEVSCSVLLPELEISCFHGLAHPMTGPAQGSTEKRIKLSSADGGCTILLEKTHWQDSGTTHIPRVEGIAVTLTLKNHSLPEAFGSLGVTASVRDTKRLVSFSQKFISKVFLDTLSEITGIYLPVPPEWAGMGKPVTHAKTIALLAGLTNIPVDEIRAMDEAIRNPSESTRDRLDEVVPAAAACLKPIPVSTLFVSSPAVS